MGQEGNSQQKKTITPLIFPTVQVSKKNVSKELAQKIHDKAAPFIKWLQEAEEETSESDGLFLSILISQVLCVFLNWC